MICCSSLLFLRILPDDGYLSITSGTWAGYELSVTRALGHKYLAPYGVLYEPAVSTHTLKEDDCCVVRHTDSVFSSVMAGSSCCHDRLPHV